MTLTKIQIVEAIQEELGLSKKKCGEIVESLLDLIKSSLESGEDVLITGFGKFCVKDKAERKGVRNITTGQDLLLPPRRVVTFKCSGKLRNHINND